MSQSCYCGNALPFEQCCHLKHQGVQPAVSAEQLMRSRYSAFCCQNIEYLIKSLHPSKRTQSDTQDIKQSMQSTRWHQLKVIHHTNQKEKASVEFVAFYSHDGKPGQIHEASDFVKQDGLWYYLDGIQLPPIKLNRNDDCWCGSGKKYKKCCL